MRQRATILFTVIATTIGVGIGWAFPPVLEDNDNQSRRLRKKIQSINLVNALNLTVPQMTLLHSLALQSKVLDERIRSTIEESDRASLKVLEAFYASLERNEIPGPRAAHRIHALEVSAKEAVAEYSERMQESVAKVTNALNSAQLKMVGDYRPCTFPTQDLIDPSRIGSASTAGMTDQLERIREMSDEEYADWKPRLVNDHVRMTRLVFHGRPDQDEIRRTYSYFLDQVRDMSDVEWELNGTQFAETFRAKEEKGHGPQRGPDVTSEFITRFLLNPDMASVYETRVAGGGAPEQKLTEDARDETSMRDFQKERRRRTNGNGARRLSWR